VLRGGVRLETLPHFSSAWSLREIGESSLIEDPAGIMPGLNGPSLLGRHWVDDGATEERRKHHGTSVGGIEPQRIGQEIEG
jgi:hypothetical protein